jgi:hypothetical protein
MDTCPTCGGPFRSDGVATIHSGGSRFHLPCATTELLDRAVEEYRAILRKGVRYFLEKYSELPASGEVVGDRFLEFGRQLEAERAHRAGLVKGPLAGPDSPAGAPGVE